MTSISINRVPTQIGSERPTTRDCDRRTAVTRSLLGYGVVAGPFYLAVGLAQALTRDGFDLSRHPLSLLANGQYGWIQVANLVLSGLMTIAGAVGLRRALGDRPGSDGAVGAGRAPALVAVYGLGLIAGGFFKADPMKGFPEGVPSAASWQGVAHMAASGIGFFCLVAACFALAGRLSTPSQVRWARRSRAAGSVILVAFVSGGALAQSTIGVASLWLAVIVAWTWLAVTCSRLYRAVGH